VQLARNLLRRFYHVLGVFFCNPHRLTNQSQNRVTRSVERSLSVRPTAS
jgi:hypothetical protein